MTVITITTITTEAKCKHCRFMNRSRPNKKDGTLSQRSSYTCGNPDSGFNKISPNYKVCDQWKP